MVALLNLADGSAFATGATPFALRPLSERENVNRLMLQVEIGGIPTTAEVDTGAPYVVCPPDIAQRIGLVPAEALETEQLRIHGYETKGHLYRLNVRFLATEGDDLYVSATTFVPEVDDAQLWAGLPTFIGLDGCLARLRFAVDPVSELFFFGPM